ncbi:MAG: hypothetical protein KBC73_18570 [Burkholderiaceae bacterium]|nr:hypothetical protein [Burkholderiaceae bacterium]
MKSPNSITFSIRPYRANCRYWSKLIRAGADLPHPKDVSGADSIAGPYLRNGEIDLFSGDILFEGEANHPRKTRGWSYWVHYVNDRGELITAKGRWSAFKAELKAATPAFQSDMPDLLKGCGDLAACVRFAHVQRMGGLETLRALAQAVEAKASLKRIAALRGGLELSARVGTFDLCVAT